MKLRGILDSKGRRIAYERNAEAPAAPTTPLIEGHQPVERGGGALACSKGCGIFSPAAFARHLTNARMTECASGVYVVGLDDPWLNHQPAKPAIGEIGEEDRARQVAEYYAEQKRFSRRPRVCDGVSKSITD
jgi:hypothetical protein